MFLEKHLDELALGMVGKVADEEEGGAGDAAAAAEAAGTVAGEEDGGGVDEEVRDVVMEAGLGDAGVGGEHGVAEADGVATAHALARGDDGAWCEVRAQHRVQVMRVGDGEGGCDGNIVGAEGGGEGGDRGETGGDGDTEGEKLVDYGSRGVGGGDPGVGQWREEEVGMAGEGVMGDILGVERQDLGVARECVEGLGGEEAIDEGQHGRRTRG